MSEHFLAVLLAVSSPLPESLPLLSDLQFLPCAEAVADSRGFAEAHLNYLDQRYQCSPHQASAFEAALDQQRWYCRNWQLLDYAQRYGSENSRRENLEELRRRIGGSAYYAGRMPPPVPWGRFHIID